MSIFNKKGRPYRDELSTIEKIADWFIAPLLAQKPLAQSDQTFLEECVFHIHDRVWKRYQATQSFTLPGLYLEVPHMKIQGVGPREVAKDTELWIVANHSMDTPTWHVSYMAGQGGKEVVFELSEDEWFQVLRFVKEYPLPCCHSH